MTDPRKSDYHESVSSSTDKHEIVTLKEKVASLMERMVKVEAGLHAGEIVFLGIQKDMASMKDSLDGVKEVLKKLNWTIILAVVGALLALIFKGHS